jgi:hypothetical protein
MLLLLRTGGSALKSGLLDERSGSSATLMRSFTAGAGCAVPEGATVVAAAAAAPPEEADVDDEG